mmetsp:Transcript_59622/g.141873  ORF Transcript_59622/g.141873 Transcript_59622/m.141873 type:complete len:225 (-) Transcript_59622:271-945(-)
MSPDEQTIFADVEKYGAIALEYAPEASMADKTFMLSMIQADPAALEYAAEALKDDKETVMAAVLRSPEVLRHASLELQFDTEVIFAVVREHREAAMTGIGSQRVLQALNSNQALFRQVWAEVPEAFQNMFIVRVSLLSGRCCHIFLNGYSASDLRQRVLFKCARMLSLDEMQVLASGELIRGTEILYDDDDVGALGFGELHDLQLILGTPNENMENAEIGTNIY